MSQWVRGAPHDRSVPRRVVVILKANQPLDGPIHDLLDNTAHGEGAAALTAALRLGSKMLMEQTRPTDPRRAFDPG
jgi:hypothetical protein